MKKVKYQCIHCNHIFTVNENETSALKMAFKFGTGAVLTVLLFQWILAIMFLLMIFVIEDLFKGNDDGNGSQQGNKCDKCKSDNVNEIGEEK